MLEAIALPLVKYALSEDVGTGDITTLNSIPSGVNARAVIVTREDGVAPGSTSRASPSGSRVAAQVPPLAEDGDRLKAGAALAQITGEVGGILKAERTALNFLQRLCGIATLTRRFVDQIAGTGAIILDTRKTTPGLRFLEKYAVKCGAGQPSARALGHVPRQGQPHRAAGGVTAALERILRTRQGDLLLEVEVESLDQLREALRPEVDRILVDNRPPAEVKSAVEVVDAWCRAHPPDSPRMTPGRGAGPRSRSRAASPWPPCAPTPRPA